MKDSRNNLWANKFSHIYIEKAAREYNIAGDLLAVFPASQIVEIDHYKDVFCRPHQRFQLQKNAQNLILAVKTDNFLYRGPEVCQNFGHSSFYYTSAVLNCIYNCDYCYLQGMYPSANITVFVNIEDFFKAAEVLEESPIYVTVSYDTDLLALEGIIPFASMWIEYAARHPDTTVEIRTKSANYSSISKLAAVPNAVLAWTLSPEIITTEYEHLTPSLDARLTSANAAISDGWKVRLCFDPVILIDDWQRIYEEFIRYVFACLPADKIADISIGAFRMSSDYLKRIKKSRFDSALLYYPFDCINGISRYPEAIEKKLVGLLFNIVSEYVHKERIYL